MTATKRPVADITTNGIRLRLLQESDLPMTREWRNQPRVREWFLHSEPIALEHHRVWYERYRDRDDDFVFIIEEADSLHRPVGQIALYNIDWQARRAEFGRLMIGDADALGKGIAARASKALLSLAFEGWSLDEVFLEMLPDNERALRVYEACGFAETRGRDGVVTMSARRP